MVIIPFILIVRKPVLGTSLVVLLVAASISVFVKIERRSFIYIIISCMTAFPVVWFFLKEYQQKRILTFINPERDPLGAGYHIIQSKIAIGSGMFTGKGFLKGTQNALSFLPEQHTDFIFAVVGEEFGFLGSLFILALFGLILYRGLRIAASVKNSYASLVAIGIVFVFVFHVVVNIGMALGVMPVVGMPLPFLSYGGSSLLVSMGMIGLLQNIWSRRHAY